MVGGSPDSSTTTTGHHDITEILLKVALNTIAITLTPFKYYFENKMQPTVIRVLFFNLVKGMD
jgi:hypothetical protein